MGRCLDGDRSPFRPGTGALPSATTAPEVRGVRGGDHMTEQVRARTEDLSSFVANGADYRRNLTALFTELESRRASVAAALAHEPGTEWRDPFRELVAEATFNDRFVEVIRDALADHSAQGPPPVRSGEAIVTAPADVVDDALRAASLTTDGTDRSLQRRPAGRPGPAAAGRPPPPGRGPAFPPAGRDAGQQRRPRRRALRARRAPGRPERPDRRLAGPRHQRSDPRRAGGGPQRPGRRAAGQRRALAVRPRHRGPGGPERARLRAGRLRRHHRHHRRPGRRARRLHRPSRRRPPHRAGPGPGHRGRSPGRGRRRAGPPHPAAGGPGGAGGRRPVRRHRRRPPRHRHRHPAGPAGGSGHRPRRLRPHRRSTPGRADRPRRGLHRWRPGRHQPGHRRHRPRRPASPTTPRWP